MGIKKIVLVCIALLYAFQALFSTTSALSLPDYSIPAIQKCDSNKLPDNLKSLLVPSHRMSIGKEFTFRLAEKQCASRLPHCMKPCPSPMTQLPISFAVPLQPTENSSLLEYYEEFEPVFQFTPKSYLRVENEYFSIDDYCVYSQTDNEVIVKICPSKCGGGGGEHEGMSAGGMVEGPHKSALAKLDPYEICIPKCCSLHKVLDLQTASCQYTQSGTPWAPLVYRSASRRICGEKRANLKFHYVQTAPNCESFHKYFLKSVPGSTRVRFRLLTNGTVVLRELGASSWIVLEHGSYCLDGTMNDGKAYTGDPMDQVLLLCDHVQVGGDGGVEGEQIVNASHEGVNKVVSEQRMTASGIAYVILLFSGIPFLIITVLVYLLVWSQQNVHGWTLLSHTLAVLLHYLAQGVANTVSRIFTSEQNASSICMIVGILNHLFVLSSFFWLAVINYDLFSMFRHLKTTVGRSRGSKRFMAYSCIAWGVPLFVVIMSVVLDQLYGLYGDDGDCEVDVIVPLYGHKSCYIGTDARAYYLYYPVGVLMTISLVFGFMTFVNMYRHDQESKKAHGDFKRNMKHRKKFSVAAKLFIVVGGSWIFETFVWSFIKENEVLPWYLIFPDVFNVFQAIAIFILFACQPKILNQVAEKYPRMRVFTELLKKLSCSKSPPDKQNGNGTGGGGGGGISGGASVRYDSSIKE